MQFKDLALFFERIEKTSSRLAMTEILAELFKTVNTEEIDKVLYLLQGRVAPLYEKNEFLVGEKILLRALSRAVNVEPKLFSEMNKKIGDIGQTVEYYRKKIITIGENNPSISDIFQTLKKITEISGESSQEAKIAIIGELVHSLDPLSCRYVFRIPTNTLRLGFSDMTILDAFSWMLTGDKSLRPRIEEAYHVRPDLGYIGLTLKKHGLSGLSHVQPALFTPILMMKAERLASSEEIIKKIGSGIVEPKYDGFRLQVHYRKKDKVVKLYSRGLEDVTFMYPDIVSGVIKEVTAKEIILEGEAIGFDAGSGSFLPFQETVQRKRKYDIEKKAQEIPLKLYAFELLYADGVNYLTTPFLERRKHLEKCIHISGMKHHDTLLLSPEKIVTATADIDRAFDEAVSEGLEGIMVKKFDGIYQPGARGWNWIKFKRSYSSKINDTIDCVVMGYDLGRGKRTDFGIGAFLVGVYDEKNDCYVTLAKIGTGLTDEEWRELKKRCDNLHTDHKPSAYEVDKAMAVDVWIRPAIVVEIRADEISRSPVHTAGRTMRKTKSGGALEVAVAGFALRFPRLEHFRDDKKSEDATSLSEIESLFKKQKH